MKVRAIGLTAIAAALWSSSGAFADKGVVGNEVEEAARLRRGGGASEGGGPLFANRVSSESSSAGRDEEEGRNLGAGVAENGASLRGVDDGTSRLSSAKASVSKDEEIMNFDKVTQDESKQELEDLKSESMNEASYRRLRNMNDDKKTQGREIRDISTDVFEELLLLHNEVHMTPFHIQGVTRRLHKIVLSAASAEDGTSSPHARRLAVQGLKSGANKLKTHAREQTERHLALLESTDVQHEDRQLTTAANIVGIAGFSILMVFLTVLLVSNIVIGATNSDPWPFLGIDNDYLNGAPGSSFDNIIPCDKLPLASDELFGYLPITQGFLGNILGPTYNAGQEALTGFLELITNSEGKLDENTNITSTDQCSDTNDSCLLTAECCKKDGFVVNCNENNDQCEARDEAQVAGGFKSAEPFCLSWSKTDPDSNNIDTIGFAPLFPWPPIELIPSLVSIAPFCPIPLNQLSLGTGKAFNCKFCEYKLGFAVADFSIGPVPFKLTIQWDGFALSWADKAKLAYGANSDTGGNNAPQIWDGFRNQPLPEIPDINFWLKLRFNIIDLVSWTKVVEECKIIGGFGLAKQLSLPAGPKIFRIILDVELYVGIDKQTTNEEAQALGNDLAKDFVGNNDDAPGQRRLVSPGSDHPEQIWRNMQDSTTQEDPCIILAMTRAAVKLPYFLGNIVFADALGGYCILPPEETGTRCSPSGFFFNIRNQFQVEGLLGGLIDTLLTKADDEGRPLESAGNSIGIFQDPNGETEAAVFRVEFPVTTIFGVPFGSGRPIVHFQYVKGSEIERRRSTLLRRRSAITGEFIPNCAQIGQECDSEKWDDFETSDGIDTQICSDFLINESQDPDKLLYYNRVLTADPVNDKYKYVISPPAGQTYKTPPKYDFSGNLGADVFIIYLAMADIGNIVILIREISLTLIFSDGPPATRLEDVEPDFTTAQQAYENAVPGFSDAQIPLFQPPSLFNFVNLQSYLDYLPDTNWNELNVTEIDEKSELAQTYNGVTDAAKSDRLAAFIRLFCKIQVLFFIEISIGLIMENFADGVTATKWAIAGQFEIEALGLLYSVAVSTEIDFDRRRHRHLEEEEYHRALASSGLEGSDWDVGFSVSCVPDSFCEAFVEFFEDLGEAIWSGMQSIATFFAEDVVGFFNDAVDAVGEWGRKFIGNILEFGEGVIDDLADTFRNGEVSQLITAFPGRVVAIGNDAVNLYNALSGGEVTIGEALVAGASILLDGVLLAGEFIVAGIVDLANAVAGFFENVFEALGDFFNIGSSSWTEVRQKATFTNINDCKTGCNAAAQEPNPDMNKIKANCWCMDELECPVKIGQRRFCYEDCYVFWCDKGCSPWEDMELVKLNSDSTFDFPRFESQKFDEACRLERLPKLAKAKENHGKMKRSAETVDTNIGTKLNGLSNFAPSNRRRRRLAGGQDPTTAVGSISTDDIQAVSKGSFDPVSFDMSYQGSQLKPDSTGVSSVEASSSRTIDFSAFKNPSEGNAGDDDTVLQQLKEGSADEYLGALDFNDPEWLSKQPIIQSPSIAFANGSKGTQNNHFVLDCSGTIQNAWARKLQSSDPTTMRRRRSRRLQQVFSETNVEFAVEYELRRTISSEVMYSLLSRPVEFLAKEGAMIYSRRQKI